MRTLWRNHGDDAETGLPLIHLGVAMINMGDSKNGDQAIAQGLTMLGNQLKAPATHRYVGDYGSNIRDAAQGISVLLSAGRHTDDAIALSFDLAASLAAKKWLSTQERGALFQAAIALEAVTTVNWQAQLAIGDLTTQLQQAGQWQRSLPPDSFAQGLSLTSQHQQPLFATLSIDGERSRPPSPVSRGMSIARHWYDLDGERIEPTTITSGQLVLVELEVNAKRRHPDALIVDRIPAGFELENQQLDHSLKMDQLLLNGKTPRQLLNASEIHYQEYRDDRFVAALTLYPGRTSHLLYLMRATTPGHYQVPAPRVEDMYRPAFHAIGETSAALTVLGR